MAPSRPLSPTQHAQHLAQFGDGVVGVVADHARVLGHLGGRKIGPERQCVGVYCDQRDAVREHVVHLLGDPRSLRRTRLRDPEALFALQRLGPLPQGAHQLSAGAPVRPPCPGRGEEDRVDDH